MPTPAEDLRLERDRIRANQHGQTPSEIFWAGGNAVSGASGDTAIAVPLNNGPRPQGAPAFRVSGGLAQTDGLSRTRQRQQIMLQVNDKYPFKTLFYARDPNDPSNLNTYLGGDRLSQAIYNNFGSVQLVNSGRKSGWGASIGTGGSTLNFINPDLSVILETSGTGYQQIGGNTWANTELPPFIATVTRRVISGAPPVNEPGYPPSPNLTTRFNFQVAFDETVSLPGGSWAPYNGGDISIGSVIWTANTTVNPLDSSQTQTLSGTKQYPIKVFSYSPSGKKEGSGNRIRIRNTTLSANYTRTQDWSESNQTETVSEDYTDRIVIPVPILGDQTLNYSFKSTQKISRTSSDTRSVAGGANATAQSLQTETNELETINPLPKRLNGLDVALCLVQQSGHSTQRRIESSSSVGSTIFTQTVRPSMQSFILYSTTGYLHSGSLVGQGPRGGWIASGSAILPPGQNGEPAPQANLYREGNPPSSDGFQGNAFSALYAFYDFPGAYGDNSTNAEVYSEYTVSEGKSIKGDIYTNVLSWGVEYSPSFSSQSTDDRIITYKIPTVYKLLTSGQIIDAPYEQSAVKTRIDANTVSAPNGLGTLSVSNNGPFGIGMQLETAVLREHRILATKSQQFNNGSFSTNTLVTANTYTSDDLSIIGKKAEAYSVVDGEIKRWSGTITAYDGSSIPDPPAVRNIGGGQTETNTFVGPYPKTLYIKNLSIAVDKFETVDHCPWGVSDNTYTIVLNSDFAIWDLLNYRWCNLVLGSGETLASVYVAYPGYSPGSVNHAAVWHFRGGRFEKGDDVKGKTKGNGAIVSETLLAVQYQA